MQCKNKRLVDVTSLFYMQESDERGLLALSLILLFPLQSPELHLVGSDQVREGSQDKPVEDVPANDLIAMDVEILEEIEAELLAPLLVVGHGLGHVLAVLLHVVGAVLAVGLPENMESGAVQVAVERGEDSNESPLFGLDAFPPLIVERWRGVRGMRAVRHPRHGENREMGMVGGHLVLARVGAVCLCVNSLGFVCENLSRSRTVFGLIVSVEASFTTCIHGVEGECNEKRTHTNT